MENENAIAVVESKHIDPFEVSDAGIQTMIRAVGNRVNAIQAVYKQIMRQDSDYGIIPGCGPTPALLKPGAEKIIMAFRLTPTTTHTAVNLDNGHREITVRTVLSSTDGTALGDGLGSCSTMETKYRYRQSERICPICNKSTIIKGKTEYGGGWICFAKKGGCGAKFTDDDKSIISQLLGRVENTDPADQYNTILKMAEKRSLVSAVLKTCGCSDIFTQDIDDNASAFATPHPITPVRGLTISEDQALAISMEVEKRKCEDGYIKKVFDYYGKADKTIYTDLCDMPSIHYDKIMASIKKNPVK